MDIPTGFLGSVVAVGVLTEIVKKVFGDASNRFMPLVAEVLGIGIGMALGLTWFESLFVGASAMGIYRGGKVLITGQ